MDLNIYQKMTKGETSKLVEMIGTDPKATARTFRSDSIKHGRKLRPKLTLNITYSDRKPYARTCKTPRSSLIEDSAAFTNDEMSKATTMLRLQTKSPMNESKPDLVRLDDKKLHPPLSLLGTINSEGMHGADTSTPREDSNADSVWYSRKLRPRLPSKRTISDKRRSYSRQPGVSELSDDITNLHLHEYLGTNFKSQKTPSARLIRPRESQEVIPTTVCESTETGALAEDIFIPCRIRHASDNRIWTKQGRTVALKVAISPELYACQLTRSPGPSPFWFAYHIDNSWYCVSANSSKRISIRKTEVDISTLMDATDGRAFFVEYDRKGADDGGMILKSGAYDGYGITVNRSHRLALSDNPSEWYRWYISMR